ncbi:MAG: hypothetical protein AAGI01_15925 [Myxococcota bacterium]
MNQADEDFGTLRSMLAQGVDDLKRAHDLMALLEEVYARDPEGYADRWAPYLEGSRDEWPTPFAVLHTPQEIRRVHALIPGARVRYYHSNANREGFDYAALHALLVSPVARALCDISMWGGADAPLLDTILESEHLEELEVLSLSGALFDDETFMRLVEGDGVPSLEQLGMHGTAIVDDTIRAFAKHPRSATLRGLGMGASQNLTMAALDALIESPHFERFTWTNLAGIEIDVQGAARLSRSRLFQDAEYIQLTSAKLGDAGLEALGGHTDRIEYLDVVGNDLTPKGLVRFFHTPLGQGLGGINCSSNEALDGKVLDVFEQAPQLPNLRRFDYHGPLGDDVHDRLAKLTVWPNLRVLSLWNSELTLEGLQRLLKAPWMDGIEELDLGFQWFEDCDAAVGMLARCPALRNLRGLMLYGVPFGDDGAKELATSPILSSLESLTLPSDHAISKDGARALSESAFLHPIVRTALLSALEHRLS